MFEIIDTHVHIYPDKIAQKAVEAIGTFYDLKMRNTGSLSELLSKMQSNNISKSVVFSVATTTKQVSSINRFISETVKADSTKLIGLGTLHPDSENIEDEVDEIIALGLKGVKLHPDFQAFALDDKRAMKIYEICEGRLPVLFHCGDKRYDYSNPDRMKILLESFKNLSVIGAHFGGYSVWEEAAEKLCKYDNFIVDSSSTFGCVPKEVAKKLINSYGTQRVMFATDYPMWNAESEIEYLLSLGYSDKDYEKIFSGNAKSVFGIK